MTIYFISDLHLQAAEPNSTALLRQFIQESLVSAEAIYILGDFFDVWIGDDYQTPFIQEIKSLLLELHKQNIPVFFMRGNRDFLLGEKFLAATHCIGLPDPYVLSLNNCNVVLTHGDLLSSLEQRYRIYRTVVQHPFTQACFLHLPTALRLAIASYLRTKSQMNRRYADAEAYAVDQEIVASYLTQHNAEVMVHGHTHLPGRNDFVLSASEKHGSGDKDSDGEQLCQRFVLGAWGKSATYLVYRDDEFTLEEITLATP